LAFAAGLLAAAGCTLDFDRYDPADASSAPDTGADGAALESAAPPQDAASSVDATSDAAGDATAVDTGADRDAGPCVASSDCLTQAGSCGVACGQVYQSCLQDCDAQTCSDACRSGEQSCLGKCVSSCIGCTSDAGCMSSGASTMCINDSHP
jgi:hypothetical protein